MMLQTLSWPDEEKEADRLGGVFHVHVRESVPRMMTVKAVPQPRRIAVESLWRRVLQREERFLILN